ncbi:unnamed protein product [Dovyalis caffra]|uniref:Carboxypeptidase n=1 Tax=Dovyalis caffra TaxID=77055 RepID=A0AAV1RWH4_9ROSI|nr:unnamed protein product [Dovyalis caffra]
MAFSHQITTQGKEIHPKILWFCGLTVDLDALASTASFMNTVSNIIYLDSPCGVGMSYSKNQSKYVTDDLQTAADTHNFLLEWFQLYPEFVSNPFYIAGESYAGIYVPTLAAEVVKGIRAGQNPIINFKEVQRSCKGNYQNRSKNCNNSIDKIDQAISGLNVYDILEPCYHDPASDKHAKGNTSSNLPTSFQQLGVTDRPLKVRKRMFGRAWPFWAYEKDGNFPMWSEIALDRRVPCIKSIAGPWELCSGRIDYGFGAGTMLPYHQNLTTQGYRALIYSGDHDMCVPFTGTQAWTRSLGHKIIDEWRAWISDDQVAG